ncbi:MAG TPA: tetratricopeptide repeat protein, partial [Anaerolineales bacterium]|nr:tetratricopeptide repeat protein [Anaerolineales bacterium]
MKRTIAIFLCGIMAWALIACKISVPIPFLATPTPAATHTPTPTPTLPPTPTATPTPTPLPAVRVEQGDYALFVGDWDTAEQEFSSVLQDNPEPAIEAAANLGLARVQSARGNPAGALETLRGLVNRFPDSPAAPTAYIFLGQVYVNLQRYGEAADAYQRYLELRPGVIDAYALEWLGDAYFNGGEYALAAEAYQGSAAAPRVGQNEPLLIKLGQASTFAGDTTTALATYDSIYQTTSNDFYRAQANYLRGEIYTLLGQPDVAYDFYRESAAQYPYASPAYLGMIRLVEAGAAVNEFDRGLVDYYAGEYSLAVAAFDRFLTDEGDGNVTEHNGAAHYYKGLALLEIDAPEMAIAAWDELIATHPVEDAFWALAWEEKGLTQWAYMEDYAGAIQTFLGFVTTVPAHPRAGEFLFFAAQVAERDGQLTQAAALWEQLTVDFPGDALGTRASFLAGITRYRTTEYSLALPDFQRAFDRAESPAEKGASALWLGKTRAAMGLEDEARLAWQQAASFDPTGYYSERALELLDGGVPFTPPEVVDFVVDWEAERREAADWIASVFPLPEGTDLFGLGALPDDPRFIRGAELWRLGLYEQARSEFEDLRLSFRDDPVPNFQLASYLVDLGLYRTAIFCARQVLTLAGMDDARTMSAPAWFNHVRFGLYYRELVMPIAEENRIHPLLVWSLMRQESLFEGFVRSSAGARGLMQIIPSTGDGIFNNLGWPEGYTSDDLYRPIVNLTFGMDYLADQIVFLNGNLYAALAAYNGGPGNARVWQGLAGSDPRAGGDPDLFLEVVRFEETRNYIRG